MSEGCLVSRSQLSFKTPFTVFFKHKFPFDEDCDKVLPGGSLEPFLGEGRTPKQAYRLILKPTLN